jgi:hypothetical protein
MRRAAAAQRRVRTGDHRLELAPVGRGEVDGRRAELRHPRFERTLERGRRQPPRGALVEHREPGVEPGRERLAAKHARAEPVDGADPGRVDFPRAVVLAERDERAADALAELGGRLLGERQRQDRADRDAVVQHGRREPLDHHRRLAGPGARGKERRAVAVGDRRTLLRGAPHTGSSTFGSPARQIPG